MEKIIHFTVPKTACSIQAEAIGRARALHPGWEIKIWRDPVQPDGFLLEKYWPRVNSGAQLADLLRLDVVYRCGGVYVDSDLILLKPLDDLAENYEFFIATEDGNDLTNALFGARKNSPVLRHLIDELLNNEPDWRLPPNITAGPFLFSRQLLQRADVTVLPRESFYPYSWHYKGEKRNHRHSYGEHLWVGSWKPEEAEAAPQAKASLFKRASGLLARQGRRFASFGAAIASRVTERVNGGHQSADLTLLESAVEGGDWVIHAGPRDGEFSRIAAQKVGRFGRVFVLDLNRPADERAIAGNVRLLAAGHTAASGQFSARLDAAFPVDMPIKLLRIDGSLDAGRVLAGATRLLRQRCLDFVAVELPKETTGPAWRETMMQIEAVLDHGYSACTQAAHGELTRHSDLAAALDHAAGTIVLVAREQYSPALALHERQLATVDS